MGILALVAIIVAVTVIDVLLVKRGVPVDVAIAVGLAVVVAGVLWAALRNKA